MSEFFKDLQFCLVWHNGVYLVRDLFTKSVSMLYVVAKTNLHILLEPIYQIPVTFVMKIL